MGVRSESSYQWSAVRPGGLTETRSRDVTPVLSSSFFNNLDDEIKYV